MTTPTMMITSMITTATTMITGMTVGPALWGEVVGLVLLLTGAGVPALWGDVVGLVLMLSGAVVPALWGDVVRLVLMLTGAVVGTCGLLYIGPQLRNMQRSRGQVLIFIDTVLGKISQVMHFLHL